MYTVFLFSFILFLDAIHNPKNQKLSEIISYSEVKPFTEINTVVKKDAQTKMPLKMCS